MVPVEDQFPRAVQFVVNQLDQILRQLNHPGELSGLISFHFLRGEITPSPIDKSIYPSPVEWLDQHESVPLEAPQLAILGSLIFEQSGGKENLHPKVQTAFAEGIERLRERQNVFTTPNSWAIQPSIVLGITFGISATHNPLLENWMRGKLQEGTQRVELPLFSRLCYSYGLNLLDPQTQQYLPNVETTNCALSELALAIWLVKHEVLIVREHDTISWLDEAQKTLLSRCLMDDLESIKDIKAGIVLATLSGYIRARSQYPRLDLVVSLLSNFAPAMERWKEVWKIENEYDIQSILWLILRTAFDDLRYEEYFPKLGRSGYRYDIGIPQLGLVIEVKYTRKRSDFQKIVDEIGKDSAQLPTQSSFSSLVVFVYDESCSVEHHAWAKQAIEQIRLVKHCVIMSAPSTSRPKNEHSIIKPQSKKPKGRKSGQR